MADFNLTPHKFTAVVNALGKDVLKAEPISRVHKYFPGTSEDDWRGWQVNGFIKLLPDTRKIALVDAAEFYAISGKARAVPISSHKKPDADGVDISDIETSMLAAADAMT